MPIINENFSFVFSESMIFCLYPASAGGAYRDRHDTWSAGCGGRFGSQHDLIMWTNGPRRTVKSYGPGIPVLMPIRRRCADDGGKNAGPQGEYEAAVKTIAQGRPGDFGCTCGSAACFFLLHADHGRQPAPGLPCALASERGKDDASPGRETRRGKEMVCLDQRFNKLIVIPGRAEHELRCAIAHRRIHTHDGGYGFRAHA
jgi:hypothetical protein